MKKLFLSKISIFFSFFSWLMFITTFYLIFYSPLGQSPGPIAAPLIPFVIATIISGPLAFVGIALALKEYEKPTSKINILAIILNLSYLMTYLGLFYVLYMGGMSI